MAGRQRFTKRAFFAAIEGSHGIKTLVASRVGCSVSTVNNYFKRYPDLLDAFEVERDAIIDVAETKLFDDVYRGDQRAYMFTLTTIGKDRGWTTRREITGAHGAPITLELSAETLELMRRMNLEMSAVASEFEAIIRVQAIKMGLLHE
jgi:AcrR family transcriptional regulator